MESTRSSKTPGKKNIFFRAAHKVSKRLSKLFSRRASRTQDANITASTSESDGTISNKRVLTDEEKEFILLSFTEKLQPDDKLYKTLKNDKVRYFIEKNKKDPLVVLLYSLMESYNKTPIQQIKQYIVNIATQIIRKTRISESKRETRTSRRNTTQAHNNLQKQFNIGARMTLKPKNNNSVYEKELAELQRQQQQGGMKHKKMKTRKHRRN